MLLEPLCRFISPFKPAKAEMSHEANKEFIACPVTRVGSLFFVAVWVNCAA